MKTKAFLDLLEKHPGKTLQFEYTQGKFARKDYHITEVKNVVFDTVDCGGTRNTWEETVVQLWENSIPEPLHRVNSTKALKIFSDVERVRPTFQETELKFEYGNANFHTAVLAVADIVVEDNITVKLFTENTTCKAKDRAVGKVAKALACCTPESGCC